MKSEYTTVLCILDGLGLNPSREGNAVELAATPTLDNLFENNRHNTLVTHGERVGLPHGQMGNSEVGHLNIGAGRVVEQWLLRISRAFAGDFLQKSSPFQSFAANTAKSPALHIIGLFSDGGVHSHSEHLYLLLKQLVRSYSGTINIHLVTDGRDTSPFRSAEQLEELNGIIKLMPQVKIASVSGRFYTMDRDKRWERTQEAYNTIVLGTGRRTEDAAAWIKNNYDRNITDEFIEPATISATRIAPEDGIIFYNFRADRARQITSALCMEDFTGFVRPQPPQDHSRVLCFTEYDQKFKLPYLFTPVDVSNHLGEVVSKLGLKQLRVAETEKYPHVTYFFNGGIENEYAGEDRKMVPSPRDVKTYDLKPEMSAKPVCDVVVDGIAKRLYDLIVVNFANCDMVGHTGVVPAGIKAVETVDECLGRILTELDRQGGRALIIADHGNAEYMINREDGTPNTAHTTFPVPVIITGTPSAKGLRPDGSLCDVAPTILEMMQISQPAEMTGKSLIQK